MARIKVNKMRTNYLTDNIGTNDGSGIGLVEGFTKGTTYGEGKNIDNLASTKIPDNQNITTPIPTKTKPQIEAFGPTEFGEEPVTSGLPIGPGPGPTTATKYDYNDFVYNSWIESGDDSLLQYLI